MSASIIQTKQGFDNSGTTFTVSLPNAPTTGNAILIVIGQDVSASCEADDADNVVLTSSSASAWQVAGAPYLTLHRAKAKSAVKTWGFHLGTSMAVTWLAAEVSGLEANDLGVPVPDGTPFASNHAVGTGATTLDTGQGGQSEQAEEFLLAAFAGRATSGVPPLVAGFANTTPQPGTWVRLGATTATSAPGPDHRLDVAWKAVTVVENYDCTATWASAPSGMCGFVSALLVV